MPSLTDIIERGQAAYRATLPEYDAELVASLALADDEPARPNITLTEAEQARACLSCALADCVDITDSRCPIRIEQRRRWREARNHQPTRGIELWQTKSFTNSSPA